MATKRRTQDRMRAWLMVALAGLSAVLVAMLAIATNLATSAIPTSWKSWADSPGWTWGATVTLVVLVVVVAMILQRMSSAPTREAEPKKRGEEQAEQHELWTPKDGELCPGQPTTTRHKPSLPVGHSLYIEQVRRLSPDLLVGRDAEIEAMTHFCTTEGREAYWWWRGGPWTGKTALLAWFVLHPPPGVRFAAFFITGRYAGHNDAPAFSTFMIEQLADILDRPLLTQQDAQHRELQLVMLLREAAEACRDRGERLVLVLDGLDEDRGVPTTGDIHSIPALVPSRLPAGARVIVTSRPNPGIPRDVPAEHPLLDPAIVHNLSESSQAKVVQRDAERELERLLEGEPIERDLLGLLTAADGGLTGPDLAELAGRPEHDIYKALNGVSGRTFIRQPDAGHRAEVYLLGHEELTAIARRFLGARLSAYRELIHAWAERYRAGGWPPETPGYLFAGYFSMLRAEQDAARMTECARDKARRRRMLDLPDGIRAADAEVAYSEAVSAKAVVDRLGAGRLEIRQLKATYRREVGVWPIGNSADALLLEAASAGIAERRGLPSATLGALERFVVGLAALLDSGAPQERIELAEWIDHMGCQLADAQEYYNRRLS
jgi:hypothetical protein